MTIISQSQLTRSTNHTDASVFWGRSTMLLEPELAEIIKSDLTNNSLPEQLLVQFISMDTLVWPLFIPVQTNAG